MATFGKTILGATWLDVAWIGVYTCRYIAPENGLVTKLTMYLQWGAFPRNIIPVIYADEDGRPNTLLAIGGKVIQTICDVVV